MHGAFIACSLTDDEIFALIEIVIVINEDKRDE